MAIEDRTRIDELVERQASHIGANLARIMERAELTQGQTAAKVGVSQPSISAIVTGATRDPSIKIMLKICYGFGISIYELLEDVVEPDTPSYADRATYLEQLRVSLEARLSEVEARTADIPATLLLIDRLARTIAKVVRVLQRAGLTKSNLGVPAVDEPPPDTLRRPPKSR